GSTPSEEEIDAHDEDEQLALLGSCCVRFGFGHGNAEQCTGRADARGSCVRRSLGRRATPSAGGARPGARNDAAPPPVARNRVLGTNAAVTTVRNLAERHRQVPERCSAAFVPRTWGAARGYPRRSYVPT